LLSTEGRHLSRRSKISKLERYLLLHINLPRCHGALITTKRITSGELSK